MSESMICEQYGPVKPPGSRELEEFARMVVRKMDKRGELHGPEDDALQWAALAVWEGVVKYGVPLIPGNRAWHFTAARLTVVYELRRAKNAASTYDRFTHKAAPGYARLVGCGYTADPDDPDGAIEVGGGSSPEDRIAALQERAARADLLGEIRRHVEAEEDRPRRLIGIALGRDSETPVGDAAWLGGATVLEVNAALSRVGKRVREDKHAVELRRQISELAA